MYIVGTLLMVFGGRFIWSLMNKKLPATIVLHFFELKWNKNQKVSGL